MTYPVEEPQTLTPSAGTKTRATYEVDVAHSSVQFKVRHLGFSKVTGRFKAFEATLHVDPSRLSTLEAGAVIQTASVTTGTDQRDEHLRSADFFDVETYPELTFKSRGVEKVDGDTLTLVGDLTIRGVMKPVGLNVAYEGQATDPWGGERVAFTATTKINRTDFGLTWNQVLEAGGLLVSEEVEIILEVQAVKQEA